jgi:hypothetical protein
MVDYWLSTKSPKKLFKSSYHTPEREEFLRANPNVNIASLALTLGLHESHVKAYLIYLGLRPVTGTKRKGTGHFNRMKKRP